MNASETILARYAQIKARHPNDDRAFLQYVTQMFYFHSSALGIMANTRAPAVFRGIEILRGRTYLKFADPPLLMSTDGSLRAAPMEILATGEYENEEHKMIESFIRNAPTGTLLDVGAHIGYTTLRALSVGVPLRSYCFEPIPSTFETLSENLRANGFGDNVAVPINLAIGDDGRKTFEYTNRQAPLASAVLTLADRGIQDPETVTVNVESRGLDRVMAELDIRNVMFIKLDVEGAELSVLRSAQETLTSYHPGLMVELYAPWCTILGYTVQDVIEFLATFGYDCFKINDHGRLLRHSELSEESKQRIMVSTDYNYFFFHPYLHSRHLQLHLSI